MGCNLGMGSDMYVLDQENNNIKEIVGYIEFGNYALGYVSPGGGFDIKYIGRSDNSEDGLAGEIIRQRDNFAKEGKKYTRFKFIKVNSVKESYHQECRNYHQCGGEKGGSILLNNKEHPKHPGRKEYPNLYCEQDDECEYSKAAEDKKKEEEEKKKDDNKN